MSSIMRWRSGETASVVSSLMVVLLLVGRGTSPRRQHTKHNLSVKTPGSSPCLDAGSQPYRGSGLVHRPEADRIVRLTNDPRSAFCRPATLAHCPKADKALEMPGTGHRQGYHTDPLVDGNRRFIDEATSPSRMLGASSSMLRGSRGSWARRRGWRHHWAWTLCRSAFPAGGGRPEIVPYRPKPRKVPCRNS